MTATVFLAIPRLIRLLVALGQPISNSIRAAAVQRMHVCLCSLLDVLARS